MMSTFLFMRVRAGFWSFLVEQDQERAFSALIRSYTGLFARMVINSFAFARLAILSRKAFLQRYKAQ
jgi:hypothetical protein